MTILSHLITNIGVKTGEMSTKSPDFAGHSPVPAIPHDIGYGKGQGETHHNTLQNNPAVLVGMGLTTLALLGIMGQSLKNNKRGTQDFMRYRIAAQGLTVAAMVAGAAYYAFYSTASADDKKTVNND
uniref:HIG1 domain-containing protein n=1 Tax=Panagrolaimus sp. JU765 TaxID=591449 RepID=A0AC34QWX1_9BILA